MLAGLQMTIGGAIMLAVSAAGADYARLTWNTAGLASLGYLTVFGSCIAYATYFWLIRNTTPDRLSTIAYVNPAVATLLGWLLLDETLTDMQLGGMIVILTGVVLVVWQRRAAR
jgi:drug/metabolite transporter (DMT)-like permease